MGKQVSIGFDRKGVLLPIASILPVKELRPAQKASEKYLQVLSSVREVGIIEPLIVFPENGKSNEYVLLDGHVRLEVLKHDEAYTYNKRVNRMATIQEHFMILKAVRSGVSEERIAKVLNVDVASIRRKRDLLNGICKEAAEILKHRRITPGAFSYLRKLKPMRQIEVAELLIATGNFYKPYVKALVAATPPEMLVDPDKHKVVEGLTPEQVTKMEKEMEALQRDLKHVEESHGNQVLNLVIARGYLEKLFANARVARYLGQHHADIFRELQTISQGASLQN